MFTNGSTVLWSGRNSPQIIFTIFCTIGVTTNATGNATAKPIVNDLIHAFKK
ncbi:MAG: hypothetical protein O3A66_01965 [Proteobacteria bacterium]|nr:hypothetical protein [Pseudomonadota bacterium]